MRILRVVLSVDRPIHADLVRESLAECGGIEVTGESTDPVETMALIAKPAPTLGSTRCRPGKNSKRSYPTCTGSIRNSPSSAFVPTSRRDTSNSRSDRFPGSPRSFGAPLAIGRATGVPDATRNEQSFSTFLASPTFQVFSTFLALRVRLAFSTSLAF